MLWLLLLVAVVVLGGAWLRPPKALWQKVATGAAAFLLVAVLIALGIEQMMQAPVE